MTRKTSSFVAFRPWTFLVAGFLLAAIVAVTALGMREFLRDETIHSVRDRHVFIALIGVLCLAVMGFVADYLAKRAMLSELSEAHERLRASLSVGKSVSWDLDVATGQDRWFGDLQTMFGIDAGNYSIQIGEFYKFVHPDDRQRVSDAVAQARESHTPYAAEFRVIRRDGGIRWVHANGEFFFRRNGHPERMLGVAVDITDRKRAEEALKKSEEKFSKAFHESPMVVTLTSATDHRYLDVNETFEQITGWKRDEVIGRTPFDIQVWVDPTERTRFVERLLAHGSIRDYEVHYLCKDGGVGVGLGSAELLEIDGEKIILSAIIDITERKRAQEALAESEEKFAKAFLRSPAIMTISDLPDGCFLEVNDTFEKVTGWNRGDVIGRKAKDFGIWRDSPERTRYLEKLVKDGSIKNIETRFTCKDGTERYGLASSELIELGRKPAVLSAIIDITDRKRAQEALAKSEEKFSKAFRQSPTLITITSVKDGRFLEVNQALEEMTGYTRNELLGHTSFEFGIWRDSSERQSFIKKTLAEGSVRNFETRFIGKDGIERLGLASSEMIEVDGSPAILTAIVDISERKRAEEALQKKQQELSEAQRIAQIGSWELDVATMTYAWSEELSTLHGIDPKLPPPTPEESERLFTPESWQRLCQAMTRAIQDGAVSEMDLEAVRPDGTHRWLAVRGQVVRNSDGLVVAVRGTAQDITERKEAELARRETEDRFRRVVEHIADAVFADDIHGKVLFANDNFLRLFGITREDLGQFAMENHIAPEYRALLTDRHRRRLNGENVPSQYQYEGLRSDGTRIWLQVDIVAIRDSTGKITGTQSALRDITERRRTESILRESEEKFRRLVEHIPDALIVDDTAGNIVYANDRFFDQFGYTRDQLKTVTAWDLVAPELRSDIQQRHKRRMQGEPVVTNYEFEAIRSVGTRLWMDADVTIVRGDDGQIIGSQKILRDITDRRRSEEALTRSEGFSRNVIQSAPVAMLVTRGLEQTIERANNKYLELFGYATDEVPDAEHWWPLAYPDEAYRHKVRTEWQRRVEQAMGHHTDIEPMAATVRCKDGSSRYIEFHFASFGDTGLVSFVDLTERNRAEINLRESEERFRLVANHAPVMIWMTGADGLCTYFNNQWLDFTGRPLEAELGDGWAQGVHPEDVDRCLAFYRESFNAQTPFQMEYRLRRFDGEYRWVFDSGVPRFNVDGSFAGFIGSCMDTTERKLAEEALASMGRRLIEAHEEERTWIGRELHDDVNQRLALVSVDLDRAAKHLQAGEDFAKTIEHARQRISELTRDVQALSHRLHSSKLDYLGLASAANSFCRELSEQQHVRIRFKQSGVPRDLPSDISLCMFRVLQEALQNGVKHSGAQEFMVELAGDDGWIDLSVVDEGIGFDEDQALRSRGLGLISMRERLQMINGQFSISSKPGAGTIIQARVRIPTEAARAIAS